MSVDSANVRGFAYLEFSFFVIDMNRITIDVEDGSSVRLFRGGISHAEIAPELPAGTSDPWDPVNLQVILPPESSSRREIE